MRWSLTIEIEPKNRSDFIPTSKWKLFWGHVTQIHEENEHIESKFFF